MGGVGQMSVEEKIVILRQKMEAARAEVARREALADQARGAHEAAMARLAEMGHESVESAQQEIDALKSEMGTLIEMIEQQLAEGMT